MQLLRNVSLGVSAEAILDFLGLEIAHENVLQILWCFRRWNESKRFKNIADGFRTEELVIERLRQVDGLTIIDRDPETGKQIEVSDFDGHALGHLDFEVFGLLQSPKTPHVGEVKCINERSFKEVKK